MNFISKAKSLLTGAVNKHGDQVGGGVDRAAGVADAKTDGRYGGQIDAGADKTKDTLDGLDGQNDDIT